MSNIKRPAKFFAIAELNGFINKLSTRGSDFCTERKIMFSICINHCCIHYLFLVPINAFELSVNFRIDNLNWDHQLSSHRLQI